MSQLQMDGSELEWEILRWAAGADVALPREPVPDERRLMELVVTHRIGPRLLRRLKAQDARPHWASEWVLAHLRGQNAKTVAQIELRFRALREICAAVPDAPPLLLKGFAPYAATGDQKFLRPSGDLDLLAPAPEPFCEALRAVGYGVANAPAHAHEFATAGRSSIGIEIHRFFPVYSFPPGVEIAELEPHQSLNARIQTFAAPPRREIYHGDLWPYVIVAQVPELLGLCVPDVTATAFILCAHEFRELIQSPFELPVPIRLALLADIHDLALHPAFDARRFLDLARQWGDSSARVIGHFLQVVFGSNPLPCTAFTFDQGPPRQIGVRGVWACLGTAHEWLLGMEREVAFERLQNCLPPISIGENCESARFLIHQLCGESLRPRLTFDRTPENIGLRLELPPLAKTRLEYKIRLESASGLMNTVTLLASGIESQSGRARVVCRVEPNGFSIRLALTQPGETLLLSISRRDANIHDFYNAQSVAVALLAPLRSASLFNGLKSRGRFTRS